MIKLAYLLPHSPLLIPSIAKKNVGLLEKTRIVFNKIKKEIISEKIDTLVIISPHRENNQEITLNNHFSFKVNFEEFGDYSSKIDLSGDLYLSQLIKESLEPEIIIEQEAQEKPDYGVAVPLFLLLTREQQDLENFKGKVVIINTGEKKSLEDHFSLAKKISPLLKNEEKKIALIASAELSHCLSYNAPGGFYQKAIEFDENIIYLIKQGPDKVKDLLNLDPKTMKEVKECGLRPISFLLGLINDFNYQAKTLAYQKDLGVGYLSMKIDLL